MLPKRSSTLCVSASSSASSAPSGVSAMLRLGLAENALNSLTTLRGGDDGDAAADGRGGSPGFGYVVVRAYDELYRVARYFSVKREPITWREVG